MGYRLAPTEITLHGIEPPGGVDAWGDGDPLVVTVKGDQTLDEWLAFARKMSEVSDRAVDEEVGRRGMTLEQVETLESTFREFGDDILISWNIEGVPATGEGFYSLPRSLAFAISSAYNTFGSVGEASGDESSNGATSAASPESAALPS